MNYYISDLHFGCCNSFDNRTLLDDEVIKENWNKRVTNADTVYILGDMGRFGNNSENEYLIKIIATLKGKKILIKGNHDKMTDYRIAQLFQEICDYREVKDQSKYGNFSLILCHYPILMWNGQHKGNILFYGHTHNSEEDSLFQESLNHLNSYFEHKTEKGAKDCPPAKAFNVGAMKKYISNTPRTAAEIVNYVKRDS